MNPYDKSSERFSLNTADWMRWARNTLLFSSPAILAFLISLQQGGDRDVAFGFAYQAFLAAAIDLIKKFMDGEAQ